MIEFCNAMRQATIDPPADILADGTLHRFHITGDAPRKENGWYVLHNDPPAGAFGCWKRSISETWNGQGHQTFTPEEKARHRANMEALKQQRQEDQARVYTAAREKAKAILDKCKPAPVDHPYLAKKGIKPNGARLSNGALVIPLRDTAGTLHGLQFIDAQGNKKFLTGTAKAGHYFAIGKPGGVLCLAEGLATGASIHESTGHAVAVAFDAGNLLSVGQSLRAKFPDLKLIFCGDNDASGTGQRAATAAALAVNGQVALPPVVGDFNDLHATAGPDAVKAQIEAATVPLSDYSQAGENPPEAKQSGDNQELEAPLLFDDIDAPEIPPDLLPGWLGDYADAVARQTQTPPAMAVMLALSTVATCTAKRFEVAPKHEGNYSEPLNLWTATALPPASRKTAVISAMTAPLVEWEKSEAQRLAPKIKEDNARRRTLLQRIKKLEKDAANTDDTAQREELLQQIGKVENEMPEELRAPRLWTGDTTPERLQSLLEEHGERMAVLTDEGGIFEVMAGLYNDGRANLDIFLQAHAGKAARIDRQTRTAYLDAPALSFGLAIQPAILADMGSGSKRRFRGNGTLARFLFTVPRSNIGTRNVRATYQIPATIEARYRTGIFDLLAIPPQVIEWQEVPRRLTLTPEALNSWQAFAAMIESRQGKEGDLETIQDWSGKLPGAALRIAGNFHLVEHGSKPPAQIEADTIERALDLSLLLIDHAKAAFAMMEADAATADAKAVLKWITEGRLCRFTKGEAYRKFKGRFTCKPERMDKALRELQARHIVTEATERTDGRAATVFNVNPMLWGAV